MTTPPSNTKAKHTFVREEYKTTYENLQNLQFIIYCTGCGYVSYNTDSGDNGKRQAELPKECVS